MAPLTLLAISLFAQSVTANRLVRADEAVPSSIRFTALSAVTANRVNDLLIGVTPVGTLESPGRDADARIARITFLLVAAGRQRCPVLEPNPGLLFQYLSQFDLADRAGMITAQSLDRGAGVIAVVPGGPDAAAGIRAGDVLLAVEGVALPPEPGLDQPFDAVRARAHADAIHDLFTRAGTGAGTGSLAMTLLREGAVMSARLQPLSTCPFDVHLARSGQRNAFADGRHVFLTTGLLARLANDDELAFVIAHELAHNILGHAAILRRDKVEHGPGRSRGQSRRIVRQTEREADALAGELLLDAAFDPVAGAQALHRLGGGDFGIDLLPDHASDGDRVAAMRALAQARRAR